MSEWIFCNEKLPDKVCECYVYLPENEERDFDGYVTIMKFFPSICTVSDCDPDFSPYARDKDGYWVIDWPSKGPDAGWHPAWVREDRYYDIAEEFDIEDVLCWQPVPRCPDPPTAEERREHE